MSNTTYNEKVLDHFKNPRNMGEMENPDAQGTKGNLSCGDVMKIALKVDNNRIEDIKFLTFGCAAAISTSSALTEIVKGKTIEEAKKIGNKQIAEALGGLPKIKHHCAHLAEETLMEAIKDWEEKKK
ncbi:iron-sulfur cluster assembly scaffold protein [archaeon]|jgi:nitrogen fixation protein NifU and related proteins|nr:iron-sulfur cluster assembly scaffold protein [archaeon]